MAGADWSVDGWRAQERLYVSATNSVFRAVNEQGIVGALRVYVGVEGAQADAMLRELNALGALVGERVPNVAEIFDVGRTRNRAGYFVVSALVEGSSLRSILDEVGTVGPSTAVAMLQGLAGGLARLHRMGFARPDINPSDIIIPHGDRFADATLMDCGGIVHLSMLTVRLAKQDRAIFGTPLYMAPEQLAGGYQDHRTDLWALGVLLFECLHGRHPYAGSNFSALAKAHSQPLVFPMPIPGIEPVLQRVLAKDPADRFQSAEEFRTALIVGS